MAESHAVPLTIFTDAITKWGLESQKHIWMEELAELIQVIAKMGRRVNGSTNEQIADEIADVDICLCQMKLLFPDYFLKRAEKIERLAKLVYGDKEVQYYGGEFR